MIGSHHCIKNSIKESQNWERWEPLLEAHAYTGSLYKFNRLWKENVKTGKWIGLEEIGVVKTWYSQNTMHAHLWFSKDEWKADTNRKGKEKEWWWCLLVFLVSSSSPKPFFYLSCSQHRWNSSCWKTSDCQRPWSMSEAQRSADEAGWGQEIPLSE